MLVEGLTGKDNLRADGPLGAVRGAIRVLCRSLYGKISYEQNEQADDPNETQIQYASRQIS